MEILVSSKFARKYKKLQARIKSKAELKEQLFKNNPFDSRLETHKLHGKDRECWSYSVDKNYRIKFLFFDDSKVLYLSVGTHDEVY